SPGPRPHRPHPAAVSPHSAVAPSLFASGRTHAAYTPRVERPVRIAYLVSRFPKLTETFVLYELLALEELGVAVDLYPLMRARQAVVHPEAARWTARARSQPFVSLPIVRAQLHCLRRQPRTDLSLLPELVHRTWGSSNFVAGALVFFPKAVRFAYEMERDGVSLVHAHFCSHPALAAFIIQRLTGIS